jgi:RNA polymerase sigma-70 factor (ECF subfamily)
VIPSAHIDCWFVLVGGWVPSTSSHEITRLLQAWCNGSPEALDELLPLVYHELHRAARRQMARENSAHTLQTTALIHEVYLRLVKFPEVDWQNRAHFFAVCSKMMRRILTDLARAKLSQKRGGGAVQVTFDEGQAGSGGRSYDLLALDEAVNPLAELDPRKSRVVELRFFGGLSVEETAEVLKISQETVQRDWRMAKVWLLRELTPEHQDGA